jgi:hypothetical protein
MRLALCLVAVAVLAGTAAAIPSLRALHRAVSSASLPHKSYLSFAEFEARGRGHEGEDVFAQVRSVIGPGHSLAEKNMAVLRARAAAGDEDPLEEAVSFVEVGAQARVQKVRSYCEICILVMQMKQRGQPHLCAGLNANYYITCIEILESLLRADKAVVYWLKNGCLHMDSTGPEIVRPCPALSICSWTPNLFAQPPSLVRDGVESLCPKDPKFLPTIPNEYKTLLQPQIAAAPGPAQGQ